MDTATMRVEVPLWAHAPSACLDDQVWTPPPPRARKVEEDDHPSAMKRGGDYRPVGQANKAFEGEVDPHLLKAYHIRGVEHDV